MASVVTRRGKRGKLREIQGTFRGRYTIRLGRVHKKYADTFRMHIEALEAQSMTGHPATTKTQAWLRDLPDKMHERIARTGLVESRGSYGLEAWIDKCLKTKRATDAKSTTTRRKQAKRYLLEHFPAGKDLRSFTQGDAEEFEAHLFGKGLAEATIRKRLADTRQWFGTAVKHKLIQDNPFENIKVAVPATQNKAFITPEDARAIMYALPSARLRLIFALARWGGLRTPSEPAALTWVDVDWERSRFTVNDVKRKRRRTVPLFPELAGPMRDWFEDAPEGSVEVFPMMSKNSAALVAPIERAIKAAGLERWPRLLQNLRASRQTELEEQHPTHVVCAWMGNSTKVASKHYLQVRESDFESAVKCAVEHVRTPPSTPAQNPANGPEGRKRGKSVAPEGLYKDPQGPENE